MFLFQASEKALCWGVVPAIAFPVHPRDPLKPFPFLPVSFAGILDSPVRGMDQPWSRFPAPGSHPQGIQDELNVDTLVRDPADNLTGKQLQDPYQI